MKIVVFGNYTKALVMFRGPLIKRFIALGHSVIAYAPDDDPETADTLKSMGAVFHILPFNRAGTSILMDLLLLLKYWRILLNEKPDILLSYTIKPVIFGSLAARLAGVNKCYSLIPGLGYVFTGDGAVKLLIRFMVSLLYRLALSFNKVVFFLNKDDLDTFIKNGIISKAQSSQLINGEGVDLNEFNSDENTHAKVSIINGSGVDLNFFLQTELPKRDGIIFLLIARLLKDKGIREYVEAAREVKTNFPNAQFWIVGPLDCNPAAITSNELQKWIDDGAIHYHGETTDVRPYINKSNVFVLPSYREGLPRTVLEAMAMGRPIITTDAPGCRETVVDGDNGFLVPVKDALALANAMEQFILYPELIEKMGRRSFEMVQERFDVNKVNDSILRAMCLI